MSAPAFPAIASACAEISAPMDEQHAQRDNRIATRRLERRQDLAEARAVAAYASELLPAVLGGAWFLSPRSGTWPAALFPRRQRFDVVLQLPFQVLFDHPLIYRRRGARGPLTWRIGAAIGRPYDALNEDGSPMQSALDAASTLAEFGIGTWARPDLSAWYPGWTSLLLGALGLRAVDASRFGFLALGEPA